MKNSSFVMVALVIMAFSSCYVGIEGEHRRHRHETRVEIHTDNNTSQKDSFQSNVSHPGNQKDSLQSVLGTDTIK